MLKALRITMYTAIALMALAIVITTTGVIMFHNQTQESLAVHQALHQPADDTLTISNK